MKQKLLLLFAVLAMAFNATAENYILYTSSDGNVVEPYKTGAFGASIVSNTYEDGQGKITFGGEVTSIGDYAFFGRSGLTSVEIPNSVTSIGYDAFQYCTGLTSVTIPNSVTSIGNDAFVGCTGLTSVEIGNSVTTIGVQVFGGCTGLTSVEIGNSVTTIGEQAFVGCSGLTSVVIPNSVKTIGSWAFSGCSGLTSITIGNSVTWIQDSAFSGCSGLTSVVIPNSVTMIDTWAFSGCSGLTSIEIPESVTKIEESAFRNCSGLTSVEIPNSVTTIEESAFEGCSGLTSIEIPESVTTIEESAFSGCSGLTSVEIPESVTTIGRAVFTRCSSLKSFTGKFASEDQKCLIVDDELNSFAPADLTSYAIPNSVTTIGDYAFQDCTGLTSIEIPYSVITIGDYAFQDCTGLTSIEIPYSVTTIGHYAFQDCSSLTSIEIPNSVISIGELAFNYCTSLAEIISYNSTPPALGTDCFSEIAGTYTIKVPNISVCAYQEATNWSDYASNISALDRSYTLTISEAGLATLWLEYDATIPTGAEVYYAKEFDNVASTVKMTKITGDVLPRETGVIVKGEAGDYTFNEADTEGTNVSSLLVGSATTQTFNETGFMFYKLTYANSDKENLGFYLANAAGTIESKPHKAYLKLAEAPASAPTRGIGIDWGDDGTTEIENVVDFNADGGTMYNLQGMPVGNDYKGIVIKNGRKMMNK